jgi:hypothetical protein
LTGSWEARLRTQLGEDAVLAIRRLLAFWLVALAAAAPALGSDTPRTWLGVAGHVASFEAKASEIATALAGRQVSVTCADETSWRSLAAANGFDPELTWAMTPFHWDSARGAPASDDVTDLSPRACRFAAAFFANPKERGARICRHGTTMRRRKLRNARREQGRARTVRVRVPILGECDNWGSKLLAVHVLAHESMHLAGIESEAAADCLATQVDAFVAMGLGASATFARSLGREYWVYYYPSQDRHYRSAECRSGGVLDLFRRRGGWPTPTVYPSNLAPEIQSFSALALSRASAP